MESADLLETLKDDRIRALETRLASLQAERDEARQVVRDILGQGANESAWPPGLSSVEALKTLGTRLEYAEHKLRIQTNLYKMCDDARASWFDLYQDTESAWQESGETIRQLKNQLADINFKLAGLAEDIRTGKRESVSPQLLESFVSGSN